MFKLMNKKMIAIKRKLFLLNWPYVFIFQQIHIYAIGIGLTDTKEVDAIASQPASANSFNVKDFDELKGLPQKIFSGALCPGKNAYDI